MASNFSLHNCYDWLKHEIANDNETTLEALNNAFKDRNIGGIIFVFILMVFGCAGNLHVLLIYSLKFKTSNYKVYIIFLAFLDMLNCCISMPLVIVYLWYPLMYPSNLFCKFFRSVLFYVSFASPFILVVIAVDRYRKICTPLKRQITVRQTKIICFLVLCLTGLFIWPVPFLYGKSSVRTGIGNVTGIRCFTADLYKGTTYQTNFNIILTTVFLAITLILPSLYYHIVREVRNHVTFTASFNAYSKCKSKQKDKVQGRKTTITLFAVTVCYVLSALPHHILALLIFVDKKFDCLMSFETGIVYYTFIWIFFFNNILNPIIYGFSDDRFRKELASFYTGIVRKLTGIEILVENQTYTMTSYYESQDKSCEVIQL